MEARLQRVKLKDLKPYENNPRKNEKAVDQVAESIKQCGYISPIVVDEDNVILAGHTRFKALQRLGYTEAQVIVETGMTEEEKRKFRILDNKTGEKAEWDANKLALELHSVDFESFDFGFEKNELNPDDFSTFFELPDGEQSEWRTMTFTLHKKQLEFIEGALQEITEPEENYGNRDTIANKITEVAKEWAKQRTSL